MFHLTNFMPSIDHPGKYYKTGRGMQKVKCKNTAKSTRHFEFTLVKHTLRLLLLHNIEHHLSVSWLVENYSLKANIALLILKLMLNPIIRFNLHNGKSFYYKKKNQLHCGIIF